MPRSIQLLTASRLTPLLAHLADTMRAAPLPPRELETIVVQSLGMRRWVTLQLADALGCVGSLELPFPARFIRTLSDRLHEAQPLGDSIDAFARDALTWRIEWLLRDLPDDAVHAPLTRYLAGNDERARFGLAERIADRFDDYQLYRADQLQAWEAGHDTPDTVHACWQAALWRALCTDAAVRAPNCVHSGTRLRRLLDRLGEANPGDLPARVTVFGVSTLPPLFVEVLAALARHVPVTVYTATLPVTEHHPLARAFGAQGREFAELLLTQGAEEHQQSHHEPRRAGLLATLQQELVTGDAGTSVLAPAVDDASLRVHSAHGNMRQLEVVRDQLLDALGADDTLRPHDLLLLVPDAGTWAPLVDAVFGVNEPDASRIPYRIADRPASGADPAATALSMLLALPGGRFTHAEVFELLAQPLVHAAAGLTEAQVDALATLTHEADARWGYDAAARVALGLPDYDEGSWRSALDRLMLGVMTGRQDDLVLGLLPHAGDTTGDVDGLARLAEWVDAVAQLTSSWNAPHPLDAWAEKLQESVALLFGAAALNDAESLRCVTALLRSVRELATTAEYNGDVSFAVMRDWIDAQLSADSSGSAFLTGGMTVAALKPMRSLPFRIIAVVGLNDGVFPRRDRRAAFDMLEHERRRGDRDLRSDDRQLFLDLLLAAEDRLILAYAGHAVHDNSPCAPSVVLDELLDHLDRRSGNRARAALLVQHPLQPFSRRYFEPDRDPRLFTFSGAQARAADAGRQPRSSGQPFIETPLQTVADDRVGMDEFTIAELAECFCNASRFFCRQALGFSLSEYGDDRGDDELLEPDRMEQGSIKARLLATALAGDDDVSRTTRRLQGAGVLPPRQLGLAWAAQLHTSVDAALQLVPMDVAARHVTIGVHGAAWRVSGTLDGVRGNTRYVVRAGSFRAHHEIRAWVEHVAMCAAREAAADDPAVQALIPHTTTLIGVKDEKGKHFETFDAPANATQLLAAFVVEARACRTAPLPFFPQAAMAWLGAHRGNASPRRRSAPKDPRREAMQAYDCAQSEYGPAGDHADPHVALCFRDVDPLHERWDEFERLATVVLGARLP